MATKEQVNLIIPTSINLLTAINDTLITQAKADMTLEIILPSLRRRALMVVKELGVLPIQPAISPDDSYTR